MHIGALALGLSAAMVSTIIAMPIQVRQDEGISRLDALMQSFAGSDRPGCAYSLKQGDQPGIARAFGMADLAGSIPISADQRFDIGSVSKSFTAALILNLEAKKKLHLDAPLTRYFDDLPGWMQPITIADLLYMQSGIPDFLVRKSDGKRVDNSEGSDALAGSLKGFDEVVTLDQIYHAIRDTEAPDFPRGTAYAYSNANYVLLRLIAEKVGGTSLDRQINTKLPTPLRMNVATQRWEGNTIKTIPPVLGYKRDAQKQWTPRPELWDVRGTSGIWISANQLADWGAKLLSSEPLARRMDQIGNWRTVDGQKRGYAGGLMTMTLGDEPLIYHLGATDAFTAGMFLLPKRNAVLAFTCNLNSDDLIADLVGAGHAEALGKYEELVFLRTWLGK